MVAMKFIKSIRCGSNVAKIFFSEVLEEYRVEFWAGPEYLDPADYFTPDLDDAIGTAHSELRRMEELE